jgi:hypothetical protein
MRDERGSEATKALAITSVATTVRAFGTCSPPLRQRVSETSRSCAASNARQHPVSALRLTQPNGHRPDWGP